MENPIKIEIGEKDERMHIVQQILQLPEGKQFLAACILTIMFLVSCLIAVIYTYKHDVQKLNETWAAKCDAKDKTLVDFLIEANKVNQNQKASTDSMVKDTREIKKTIELHDLKMEKLK